MNITVTTPALLFPAISLLLLAYTNRFLATASLIRQLHGKHLDHPKQGVVFGQIRNLRLRLRLIKYMQIFGVTSLFGCVASMFFLFQKIELLGNLIFGLSLLLLLISLGISIREVFISTKALDLELSDMELD